MNNINKVIHGLSTHTELTLHYKKNVFIMTTITKALSNRKSVSARNLESVLSPQLNVPYFIKEASKQA
jgi:hypothetical protein